MEKMYTVLNVKISFCFFLLHYTHENISDIYIIFCIMQVSPGFTPLVAQILNTSAVGVFEENGNIASILILWRTLKRSHERHWMCG